MVLSCMSIVYNVPSYLTPVFDIRLIRLPMYGIPGGWEAMVPRLSTKSAAAFANYLMQLAGGTTLATQLFAQLVVLEV